MYLNGLNKGKVIYSVSSNYVGRPCKGLNNFLTPRTKNILNKKHKVSTANAKVVRQDFMNTFEDFKDINSPRSRVQA